MKTQKKKYFVIGFNKTATFTLHKLFQLNHINSYHGINWNLEKSDAFADNGEFQDFKKIDKDYPNSIFILNTRPLEKWIISRFEHGEREKHVYAKNGSHWAYPTSEYLGKDWSLERNNRHLEILDYFKERPEKLIIINIELPNWEKFICYRLSFPNSKVGIRNRIPRSSNYQYIKTVVRNTIKKHRLNSMTILTNDPKKDVMYLELYKSNIDKNNLLNFYNSDYIN